MSIKTIFIVFLALLAFVSQNQALASNKSSSQLLNHTQSVFCAEATDEELKKLLEEEQEEEEDDDEPDCD